MHTRLRSTFFWTFVVLCLATILVIILRSAGYQYNFEKGIFTYSGSITVKVNPQAVHIDIDGTMDNSKTSIVNGSYHMDGIRPGTHTVTISAPGFRSWKKEISVSSGISTEFWNVLLTREDYPFSFYSPQNTRHVYPSPKSGLLAITAGTKQESTLLTLDTKSLETKQVFSSKKYRLDDKEGNNVEWSLKSDHLLIPTTDGSQKNYFIVDTTTLVATDLKDISKNTNYHTIRWDPKNDGSLLYLSDGNLWRVDLQNTVNETLLIENVRAYDISSGDIYYTDSISNLVWKTSLSNPTDKTQITTTVAEGMTKTNDVSLTMYDQDRFFLLDRTANTLFLFNNGDTGITFRKLPEIVSGAQFSDDGKKLLYWNDYEIFTYFLREWKVQPSRTENQNMEIARFSQLIRNVQWTKDYEHVLFSIDKTLKVIELDNRNRNTLDITTLASAPSQILSDMLNDTIYLIAADSNTASENSQLFSFRFPEIQSIFGFLNQ